MTRVVKYDVLRIAASFAIVLLHVSASYWNVVNIHSREFLVMTIYNSLTRFAVPVFFMLSGLFLVSPDRENPAVIRRFLKLLMLFYVWSAFYAFQGIAIDTLRGAFSIDVWKASVQRFIRGHSHMWFIPLLLGFYLLIPVARQICIKKEILQYYLVLWIAFRFFLPYLTNTFHLYLIQARIDSLGLDILVGYFGYFLLGYYLSVTNIKKEIRLIIYAMGLVALCLTAFLTIRDCMASDTCVESWFSPSAPNVLVLSIAIFTCFKYTKALDKLKRPTLWQKISGYTFFVYMFHMFVIEKLNLIGVNTLSFPVLVSIPMITIFSFGVSLLGAYVADHIPIVRKIVMLH